MSVDTSREAVLDLAIRFDSYLLEDAAATLRALLAERDAANERAQLAGESVASLYAERDAARAEAARLREALLLVMEGAVWQEAHLFIDGTPLPAGWRTKRMPTDEALTAARAALAGGKS